MLGATWFVLAGMGIVFATLGVLVLVMIVLGRGLGPGPGAGGHPRSPGTPPPGSRG